MPFKMPPLQLSEETRAALSNVGRSLRDAREAQERVNAGLRDLNPLLPPDPEADGYAWPSLADMDEANECASSHDGHPCGVCDDQPTSVALEAHQAVYGDRGQDYGHPRDHWTRTAVMWTALLQDKLADGEFITPEDVGRLYIADKLSRDVHSPKRDNRVDIAGYAVCLDRLETGK